MGMFNAPMHDKTHLPEPIKSNRCIFCHGDMLPADGYQPTRDSFDYKCESCNPRIMICMSGSLLVDSRLQSLSDNEWMRKSFQKRIGQQSEGEFFITGADLE